MKSHTPFDWRPSGYRGFKMRDADTLTSVLVRLFLFLLFLPEFSFFPPFGLRHFWDFQGFWHFHPIRSRTTRC